MWDGLMVVDSGGGAPYRDVVVAITQKQRTSLRSGGM